MKRDKFGREIKAGDLIKIPHFTAARRRKIYMYKVIVKADNDLKICSDGRHLYAVCPVDMARKASLDKAHKCPLHVIGECEIIDGGTIQENDLWWERERVVHNDTESNAEVL